MEIKVRPDYIVGNKTKANPGNRVGNENKVKLQFFDEFQYKLIDLTVVSNLKLESFLNSLGKEGWELIDRSDPYRALFKRKLITV